MNLNNIQEEFTKGFELLKKYPKSVSFFGSSLFKEDNEHYRTARRLAGQFAKLGYAIITGAGGGIMEAANRGAFEVGGQSVGLNIKLPETQSPNKYLTDSTEFSYFFSRKTVLSFAAEAYLFFPGGFGTLDEFFEILELLHTKKIFPVPLILVGSDYWNKLDDFIRQEVFKRHQAIKEKDMLIYQIVDDEETIIKLVTELPKAENRVFSTEYRNNN
ncbi:MAG: TIGR00730 family Rossman fold protein [Patescibacteria group bacterium]